MIWDSGELACLGEMRYFTARQLMKQNKYAEID
jgi:hypothetical protein